MFAAEIVARMNSNGSFDVLKNRGAALPANPVSRNRFLDSLLLPTPPGLGGVASPPPLIQIQRVAS